MPEKRKSGRGAKAPAPARKKAAKAAPEGRRFRGLAPAERQAQRREQFVQAGLELFGTRGFAACGVRELCAQARLTERYFYESFANREALFQAVYEQAFARLRNAVTVAIASAPQDISQLSRQAIRAVLQTLRDDPRLSRILLIDVLDIGAEVSAQSRLATQSFVRIVGELVAAMYPQLPAHGVEVELLANGLVGSTLHLIMHWAFGGFREPLESIVAHCALFYEALGLQAQRLLETPAQTTRH